MCKGDEGDEEPTDTYGEIDGVKTKMKNDDEKEEKAKVCL